MRKCVVKITTAVSASRWVFSCSANATERPAAGVRLRLCIQAADHTLPCGRRSYWEIINQRQVSEDAGCSHLMEITGTADGRWENILQRKKTANFNPMAQIPTAAKYCGARNDTQTLPDWFPATRSWDIQWHCITATLIAKFNCDLGIFPSSYLSPSVVGPAMLTRPLSISCARQGRAARPRVEKRGLKEGKLQLIIGR